MTRENASKTGWRTMAHQNESYARQMGTSKEQALSTQDIGAVEIIGSGALSLARGAALGGVGRI